MSTAAVQVWTVRGVVMHPRRYRPSIGATVVERGPRRFALPIEAYDEASAIRGICKHFDGSDIRIDNVHRCLNFERELAKWSVEVFTKYMGGPF